MGLEVIQKEGEVTRVEVKDEMTIYTTALHWEQLQPLLPRTKSLELDLSTVTEMDSSGVQLLIALKQASDRLHNRFALLNPNELVREMLQLFRVKGVLTSAPKEGSDG